MEASPVLCASLYEQTDSRIYTAVDSTSAHFPHRQSLFQAHRGYNFVPTTPIGGTASPKEGESIEG